MLGKLIKYDIKALSRFLPVLYGTLTVITLLIRFNMVKLIMFDALGMAVLFAFILLLILMVGATELFIGIHFYRSLFSDEGYLTHTLPVSSSRLLLSKTVAGSIWLIISVALSLILACIVMSAPFLDELFHIDTSDFAILFLLCILQGITDVIIVNGAVAIGQLFLKGPILGAVTIYFIISTAASLLESVCNRLLGSNPLKRAFSFTVGAGSDAGCFVYSARELTVSVVLSLATAAALYLATDYILKKKINLT